MKVFLVGGAVRDQLLGKPVKDKDWVVVGSTPEEMLANGFEQVGKDFPVFLHPQTHEEYALARTERKQGKGYTGFVCHAAPDVTLEEDLLRRDLTINAIAQTLDGELIDPFNGCEDLEKGVLRHVSPAFAEDPLRILRVARFAARYHHLGFTIAPETLVLMIEMVNSGEASHLVAERVWQETERALAEPHPAIYFQTLHQCGALNLLISPLAITKQAIPDAALNAIEIAVTGKQPVVVRFAAFIISLITSIHSIQQTSTLACFEQFAENIKLPNQFKAITKAGIQLLKPLTTPPLSANTIWQCLKQADAARRAERFEHIITALNCAATSLQQPLALTADKLLIISQKVKQIDIHALQSQGKKGKALGNAIAEQQLSIISQTLASQQ
ncbi:multifunctional CCA tRNA nucleotidyl transferase/2'3'-cyclic phosphodiesterase/2'nucleotidase/phosphatase [Spartinivicinus ruber]|uniref:multifunctional CCA tRNA nucleotidyl transferase/2'3'-cyclic phosphodiesterase/2'nucleotidase/phosphatase n=1 Tax=Spartinivicinus ruber TaxID=2683272 RepID=UPI0013CFB89A|nr:multifunctional CCA tRNA nucleotidyl transferase/2'3'-cyclic phosphodiesterase/2'nucleotidase/phosphatase [Spartinivicinus ruber]